MSVSTWFRANEFDKSWQALIADGESNRWRLHRRSGDGGFAWVGGNGDTPAGADVTIGEWNHIVAIADANAVEFGSRVYLNGEIYAERPEPANLGSNDFNVMIGENPDARGRTWNGDIDDVALWNRPLSAEEVAALGAGPLSVSGTTLPHYDSGAFSGDFVHGRDGAYIVFSDVMGSSFVLEGQPIETRAPINGIDILIGGGFEPPAGGGGKISSVALTDGNVVIQYEGTLVVATNRDEAAALALGRRVETGTFFMNRCDYLDPGLAWTGVKDSGRGCTLSRVGYEQLTRPKSFHLRHAL